MTTRDGTLANRGERGALLTEYSVLIAFLAIALVAATQTFGGALLALYNTFPAMFP